MGGEAGAGMVLPCDGACGGDTPICHEPSSTCVECLEPAHCSAPTDLCDTASSTCVECLEPTECADASASRCNAGSCSPCQNNTDCAHIPGKSVCDAGQCVQCTGTDYAACGKQDNVQLVCNSLTKTCSSSKEKSAGLCDPCVSDAQCLPGRICMMERYGTPAQDLGYRCFWQQGADEGGAPDDCAATGRPYVDILSDQISIDGVQADICGHRAASCTAMKEFGSKNCATNNAADDTKCGVDPPNDAKCVTFGVTQYRCTVTCLGHEDCPNGSNCDQSGSPWFCTL
jgi:hypothetical protein